MRSSCSPKSWAYDDPAVNPAVAESTVRRAERLADLITERELDQLFVSDLTNVRYLTGFTGTNGACLVGPEERIFFTDFRYTERARDEVGPEWERPEAERELVPQIAARMSGQVGFED